jgi:hypothetical protein
MEPPELAETPVCQQLVQGANVGVPTTVVIHAERNATFLRCAGKLPPCLSARGKGLVGNHVDPGGDGFEYQCVAGRGGVVIVTASTPAASMADRLG